MLACFPCASNASIHWILRRERYLAKNNSFYATNPLSRHLIKEANERRMKLLSKPCANKYYARSPKNFDVMNKGTVRSSLRRIARRPKRSARDGYCTKLVAAV